MIKRGLLTLMGLALVSFLGCAGLFAQATSQEATPAPKATTHHAMRRAHSANPMAQYQTGIHNVSGTLTTVDSSKHLVIVKDSDGIPFDFVVTRGTRIEVNGKKDTLDALDGQTNQQVTVKFRDDLHSGLRAVNVTVGG